MKLDIEDRIAITDLINQHGHHADDGNFDAMLDLFTTDVVLDLTGVGLETVIGHERIRALAKEIGDDNPVAHTVSNIVLSPIGPDEVHARAKGIAVMADGRAGSATYEDVVIRTEAGWRISHRRIIARKVPLSGAHHQG
ncbi:MAG TPA: nuclear transport factor 2 family protein [Pseudonocardiaceae bacterium]|nr:nuclear transport factor 2 family protein [Pseudonocardiaceae bacterium]